MKVVLLAGGLGTRISEESYLKPKPMIEIGGQPILWHIMKEYNYYGFNEFIICCGYKQHVIKKYFADYYLYGSDVTFDFTKENEMVVHNNISEPWKVTLVDTGLNTMTGGRLKRIRPYLGSDDTFMITYGDGVCDLDIQELLNYHKCHGKLATLTAVQPEGRFGVMDLLNDEILSFREKSKTDTGWINGGYMVLNQKVLELIDNDQTVFEAYPLEKLAETHQLMCYKHAGFWKCMDTKKDMDQLNTLWEEGKAPWRKW